MDTFHRSEKQEAYFFLYICVCLSKIEFFLEGDRADELLQKASRKLQTPMSALADVLSDVLDDYVNHSEEDIKMNVRHFCSHYCHTFVQVNELLSELTDMLEREERIRDIKKILFLNMGSLATVN